MVSERDIDRLFDGEVSAEELPALVAAIAADPQLRERWTARVMSADALHDVAWPDDGYTQRILHRLAGVEPEPGYDPLAGKD